ncbi:MAG: hypothetical protein WD066_09660 [Planctomycetaceae bacterium]
MNPKRAIRILLAVIVLLVVGGGAAIYFPYTREKAALEEFERFGVPAANSSYDRSVWTDSPYPGSDGPYGEIHVEPGGPFWLRDRLSDRWMRPFKRVSLVFLNEESPDVRAVFSFAPCPDLDDWIADVRRQFPPMPDELKARIVPLLLQMRSLDSLTISQGLLDDQELLEVRRRFPAIRIWIADREGSIDYEWPPATD